MKRFFTLLVFAAAFFSSKTYACSCLPIPSFCETIVDANTGKVYDNLSILRVQVTSIEPNGIKALVLKNFHGPEIGGETIQLVNGNGANCGLIFSDFFVDEEYVLAARKGGSTWHVSACGVNFLKIPDGVTVIGPIAPGVTSVEIADFAYLDNCGSLYPSSDDDPDNPADRYGVQLRPSLGHDAFTLTSFENQVSSINIEVFDALGRVVYQDNSIAYFGAGGKVRVDTQTWSSGIYYVRTKYLGRQSVHRFVKA